MEEVFNLSKMKEVERANVWLKRNIPKAYNVIKVFIGIFWVD